jgi:hypothetical protein
MNRNEEIFCLIRHDSKAQRGDQIEQGIGTVNTPKRERRCAEREGSGAD